MSIPLDRLYQYIEGIAKEIDKDIIIYRYWPHGSKKLNNLGELHGSSPWQEKMLKITITCHDQEPLDADLPRNELSNNFIDLAKSLLLRRDPSNNLRKDENIYSKMCLLHSEKRSKHVAKYQQNDCVPVYYWSHALISLDWFRFAQHIQQKKHVQKRFLIYNRAWSGTREYRLYFSELLINLNLQDLCRTTINSTEPELGIHYTTYQFKNPVWQPEIVLENYFPVNTAHSYYSADFDIEDYEATDIEVVLETIFDDDRLHLTEKSLRPIACGQPFILAGTQGSLKYLRSYGFQTFGDIWDEGYDLIEDSQERLHAITNLMKEISCWTPAIRERKMAQTQVIAEYNRQHFFSTEFFEQVTKELKENLTNGINQTKLSIDIDSFLFKWNLRLTSKEFRNALENPMPNQHVERPTIGQVNSVLDTIKQKYL